MIEWNYFVQWAFLCLISVCAVYISSSIAGLKSSVEKLNEKMATIIERTTNHERRIDKLEQKIET